MHMSTSKFKNKKKYGGWVKYLIFNVILFGAFFTFGKNGGEKVSAAATATYEVHQTNHKGSKNDFGAKKMTSDYFDLFYVQGTGVAMKDVVTVTLEVAPYKAINGIVAFETGNTSSGNKNYDSYKKSTLGVWENLKDSDYATNKGLAPGVVVNPVGGSCAAMDANSNQLKANLTSASYYSMMCIVEDQANDKIVIKYAYTIRNAGYGQKEIIFALYNDSAYDYTSGGDAWSDPMYADTFSVSFISAKPISEFEIKNGSDDGFTWIKTDAGTCASHSSVDGRPATNDICVIYTNDANGAATGKTTAPTTMKVMLPKEVAYLHNVTIGAEGAATGETCDDDGSDPTGETCISSIKNNSLYATNEFKNVGSASADNFVRYYYYDFKLTDSAYLISGDTGYNSDTYNDKMSPEMAYFIRIAIDASGDYTLIITDIFGNVFRNDSANVNEKIEVRDVSKTEIIVDYANEVALTIMEAEADYDTGSWKGNWEFRIITTDSKVKILFAKIKADEIEVVIHIFQRIIIENGVYAKNGTEGSDTDAKIEPIAKEPLGKGASTETTNRFTTDGIKVWRVADISGDNAEISKAVPCDTIADANQKKLMCIDPAGTDSDPNNNISYSDDSDIVEGVDNVLKFKVKSNGRYRIMVTDTYGNTTNTLSGDMKNPAVEITVIDRTTPIVTGATSPINVETYDYVQGGGEKNPSNPEDSLLELSPGDAGYPYWQHENYTTIYYNAHGEKVFDYKDIIDRAKIKVVDNVEYYNSNVATNIFANYSVDYNYNEFNGCWNYSGTAWAKTEKDAGYYCDPSDNLNSNRNTATSSISYNIHDYIINNNITSFTAGLVKQVDGTSYVAADDYVKTTDAAYNTPYVNGTGTFLGYLKIVFKTTNATALASATSGVICSIGLNADGSFTSESANQDCFEIINKYVDEVEEFDMVFTVQDYNASVGDRHTSAEFTVRVKVVDTTAPGIERIDKENATLSATEKDKIWYLNERANSECILEIDNDIQNKTKLLECYRLMGKDASDNTVYNFKDNNVNHASSYTNVSDYGKTLGSGIQPYDVTVGDDDHYHQKVTLQVEEEGTWYDITDSTVPHLYKSGYHKLRIRLFDHRSDVTYALTGETTTQNGNVLTVYVTYYVNPRTLLIEPLANEKMYGEDEPTFDYCVYVNKNNETFYLKDHFFESNFINTYFNYIYCTRDVYVEIVNSNKYAPVSTAGGNYVYLTFDGKQSDSGQYLKVNNTYVKIEDARRYNMSWVQSNTGDYLKVAENDYRELKSGYIYYDAQCLYSTKDEAAGRTDAYFKYGNNCVKIENANRHTKKYQANTSGAYLKYNLNTVSGDGFANVSGNANDALVNNNVFTGNLARLESSCYNIFADNYHSNTTASGFANNLNCNENTRANGGDRNDNVGQYHIVLGTLSIQETTGTKYNEDYVIKMNTNYVATGANIQGPDGTNVITFRDGNDTLTDDGLKTESVVNFTIRQAVLTVIATGSSKKFGEQDPYSHNWNNVTTGINNALTGYLKGYTVSGLRKNGSIDDATVINDANKYIISGVLRRQTGENVGIYDICNVNLHPTGVANACNHGTPGSYSSTPYYFAAYDKYAIDGSSTEAALTIRTNLLVYGNAEGRTLNTDTRNYAIAYIEADFVIEAVDLVVQPGVNQGKEYAAKKYNDPLWQLVVYGETISLNGSDWQTNVDVLEAGYEGFSGYTAKIDVNTYPAPNRTSSPYSYSDANTSADTEVYYSRRKVSPAEVTYQYVDHIQLSTSKIYEKTTITATKSGSADKSITVYFQSSGVDNGKYIYAYGQYFEITADNRYSLNGATQAPTGDYLKIVVTGRLVNERYSLFTYSDDGNSSNDFKVTRSTGENVGWYAYNKINNYTTTTPKVYTIKSNGLTKCTIANGASATADGSITVSESGTEDCRNYNVLYRNNASAKKTDGSKTIYETVDGDTNTLYKPNGIKECSDTSYYSHGCSSGTTTIMFEIFKREIIIEFTEENYTFIYGQRYEYYDGGKYSGGATPTYQYNTNTGGVFYINDNSSEGDLFLCYSDLGDYLVNCTSDNDYGITSGDTWSGIGLKFYLHNEVSGAGKGYYYTSTDKAIPAGKYYVYADISSAAKENYKFTYKGGIVTIKPKVTNVQLTGYTMEYGALNASNKNYYNSYGLGTNYSEYTYTSDTCWADSSFLLSTDETLFTGCSITTNTVGNTYGFVIEGLDAKDAIANNFVGRPDRESKGSNTGTHPDVGFYKIGVGSISTKKDGTAFKECTTNLDNGIVDFSNDDLISCVWVGTTGVVNDNAINYNIDYSKTHNEGAYLFVLPASLDISVEDDQTKMYGCAYSTFKDDASYYYDYNYNTGYVNCVASTSTNVDLAYKYNVSGDRDNTTSSYSIEHRNGTDVVYSGGTTLTLTKVLLGGVLYRVNQIDTTYVNSGEYGYNAIKTAVGSNKYQGQAVGVYTITLGDLNVVENASLAVCDAYNNPSVNGTLPCRNYNINYYGNSASADISTHKYTDTTSVNKADLQLYSLDYKENLAGEYVLINGRYINIANLSRYNSSGVVAAGGEYILVDKYVNVNSLIKYDKVVEYEKIENATCSTDSSNCYIYLEDGAITGATGYVLLSGLAAYRYTDSNGTAQDSNGGYLKVTKGTSVVYVSINSINKYKKNSVAVPYVENNSTGAYVLINGAYVRLDSLKKYIVNESGTDVTYVEVYDLIKVADAVKYKLDVTSHNMYKQVDEATTKNLYVFVNGSYIPYNSLDAGTSISVNSAEKKKTGGTEIVRGSVSNDVKFTITARIVYVHPEYNVRPYQEVDPVEYIGCDEIKAAYSLSNFDGRSGSYCGTGETKVELGTTMYYAIQNSLATYPWTVWTDKAKEYNDIQYDVVKGKVSRYSPNGVNDTAGKYAYDFANVTTNDDLSGKNYMIMYVTNTDPTKLLKETYVQTGASSYAVLDSVLFTGCDYGDDNCVPKGTTSLVSNTDKPGKKLIDSGYKVTVDGSGYVNTAGGTSKSISLIKKYKTSTGGATHDYWYLGFYLVESASGRENELSKWWTTREDFSNPYNEFRMKNDSAREIAGRNPVEYNYFPAGTREVYFEIIKRTIYLYAVDVEKTYGDADKYSDFLVAICPNDQGYVVDGNKVKCKSEEAAMAYGLGATDKPKFVDSTDDSMKQWAIKHSGTATDYMFVGSPEGTADSFGIYFRRQYGENAGVYTITACATQTGISDCTHEIKRDNPNYSINYLSDNYEIVEIPGVMVIKTREVVITPDSNQGFQYGNYTENGSMPNITFTESRSGVSGENGLVYGSGTYLFDGTNEVAKINRVKDGTKYTSLYEFTISSGDNAGTYTIDGVKVINKTTNVLVATITVASSGSKNTKTVVIGTKTYTIIQKASCLINISGINTVCISDGQNEALANALSTNYYEYFTLVGAENSVYTDDVLATKVYDGSRGTRDAEDREIVVSENMTVTGTSEAYRKTYYTYDVYGDSYSNPANLNSRSESDTRIALDLMCSTTIELRYSRDVCDYTITAGEFEDTTNFVSTKTTFYVFITTARLYKDNSGTKVPIADGIKWDGKWDATKWANTYVKYGNGQYEKITSTNLVSYVCDDNGLNCSYTTATGTGAVNNYIKITDFESDNYKVSSVDTGVSYKITAADIMVTPIEEQYKIYGEADIEIKFTVETTYTVARTQYQNFADSNIVRVCNASICYEGTGNDDYSLNKLRYANYGDVAVSATGTYILLVKGWVVTLNSYAYDEENSTDKGNNLDYGNGYTSTKHEASKPATAPSFTTSNSAVHYDKYTNYKATVETHRILIGNLYVRAHDQTVGEKDILCGMEVINNAFGKKNYSLDLADYQSKIFVIIPRPVNIQIQNVTKIYGQATDKNSCDSGITPCVVGDGILIEDDNDGTAGIGSNEDLNEDLLKNNYKILNNGLTTGGIVGGTAMTGGVGVSKLVKTSTYTDGFTVEYLNTAINMPTVTYSTVSSGRIVSGLTESTLASGADVTAFYTEAGENETGPQEKKNSALNVAVVRENTNLAKATDKDVCFVSGETNCEDAGEYHLRFAKDTASESIVSAVEEAYYGSYWGYNSNYYAIIYNNFRAANGSWDNTYFYDSTIGLDTAINQLDEDETSPSASATLMIRKRSSQMVVETINEYEPTRADTGSHLKVTTTVSGTTVDRYYLITETNRYRQVSTTEYVHNSAGTWLYTGSDYVEIVAANRYNLKSITVGEKYAIEQSMNVPSLPSIDNDKATHHTTYDTVNYKNITWYEHPMQVRTKDALVGEVAYCQTRYILDDATGLDGIRDNVCDDSALRYWNSGDINDPSKTASFFDTTQNGHYIITRETDKLYISYDSAALNSGEYEANNYVMQFVNGVLQIDLDETPPVINIETEFIIKEANNGDMIGDGRGDVLAFLEGSQFSENLCKDLLSTRGENADGDSIANVCKSGTVFAYTVDTDKQGANAPSVSHDNIMTLLRWFGISTFDPGIIRAGNPVTKYYSERLYIAIQDDFDQQKAGDYSLFIYAQDDVGNISLATMVTLRIVDNTKPIVGSLNLYNAKVKCEGNVDCKVEDNWVVAEDVFLPIHTLTTDNINAMKAADKNTKYTFTGKTNTGGSYVYNFVANNSFGTYYKITAGTPAKAVKHNGWTNTATGIYMTITGGDDNTLAYLNTSGYTKYVVDDDANTITVDNSNGDTLLLGSFVNVDNLTKYRRVQVTSGEETPGSGNMNYMPDKNGTIIKYKGNYYNLTAVGAEGGYAALPVGYIGTAPTNTEYTVKLYSYKNGVYTEVTSIPATRPENTTYFLLDGELYEIPTIKYDATGKHSNSGTYVNLAQWNQYYSRDAGNTWIKYDRDTREGYLVLNQDGQRLIAIKAIDNGYTYNATQISGLNHIKDAYCDDGGGNVCRDWGVVTIGTITITDDSGNAISYNKYVGNRVWNYNISDWETYSADGNRDRQYAYLDTIVPHTTLADQFIEVYEYGCADISKCSNNHPELFGKAVDGYLFNLDNLIKYNSSGVVTDGGEYVRVNNELIHIEDVRRFNLAADGTITASATGTYIYLGKTDTTISVDKHMTKQVGNRIAGNVDVYDQNKAAKVTKVIDTAVEADTETASKLLENTIKNESGVGLGTTIFDGYGNAEKTFGNTISGATVSAAEIADKYVSIFIYADVSGGTGAITGNPYFTNAGYYKFVINLGADTKYQVQSCFDADTVFKDIGDDTWCSSPTTNAGGFNTMKEAMESLLSVYKAKSGSDTSNAYDFKGNEITFTLDYKVYDLAGNASVYQRKGILLSGFTRTIGVVNGGGAAAAALAIEVPQNANLANALSQFEVVTTTGKSLRNNERILQSVYYNGELVSSRAVYDLNTLNNLDTSVPGAYRIVYSIERKDGLNYVEGNSVELNITVKPTVANVTEFAVGNSAVIIAFGAVLLISLAVMFVELKKRLKNN